MLNKSKLYFVILQLFLTGSLLNLCNCQFTEDVPGTDLPVATTTTNPPQGSTASPSTTTAFSAARNSSLNITDNRVYFNNLLLNDGGHFDLASSTFIAPYSGLYWLSMSVGVDSNSEADAYMTGAERMSNVLRGLAVAGYDVVSRDEIFELNGVCNQVKMWSSVRVFSDNNLQTSLSGFSLNTVLESTPVAFSFALSTQFTCPTGARVPFNIVMLDQGNGWSSSISEYIAPRTGTYVFSLSVGSQPNYQLGVALYNSGALIAGIQQGSTNHNYESLSKTVLADVDAGEHVYMACGYLYTNSYLYSDVLTQTKLTGFLYRPRDFQPVAWSVATSQVVQGFVDYVSFPTIITDLGGGWISDRFIVPSSGVYYINWATGINTGAMTRMELVVNNIVLANVYRSSTNHNGVRTRSRSIVSRLYAGDVMHIRVPSGYQLYSADNRLTTFSGFLLYL